MLASGLARADNIVLPLPPEDQQKVTDNLGPGVVGNALPSKPIQDASVYFPLRDEVLTYQITVGPDAGTTQTFGLAKVARFGEKLAWRFQVSPLSQASSVRHQGATSLCPS